MLRKVTSRLQKCARKKRTLVRPEDVSMFLPSSSGNSSVLAKLTTISINQTIPLLDLLHRKVNRLSEPNIHSIDEFSKALGHTENIDLSKKLERKFNEYGSDKSFNHNYHLVYSSIFQYKQKINGLLEIGLGSNNLNIASHMGKRAKPGSSLRAFRDVLPNAFIYGADIDKNILFEEERIETFFVDQTNLDTFNVLNNSIKQDIDIIIDDGLHSPNANLATFLFALERMENNSGGIIVIEDIPKAAVPLWKLVANIVDAMPYRPYIVETQRAYMFVCIGE